jgi:20S proteasome subunit beta 4
MESVISLTGKDFGIIAVDTMYIKSILTIKKDLNKIIEIAPNIFIVVTGSPGDISQFLDLIQKSIQLQILENETTVNINSIANFMRQELSSCLRKGPMNLNMILIGYSANFKPSIYFLDYLGNLQKMNFCAMGYSSSIIYSLIEKYFDENMNLVQGLQIITKCISTIRNRFLINHNGFLIKVIYRQGAENIGVF